MSTPVRYTTAEVLRRIAPDNRAAAIVKLRRMRIGRTDTQERTGSLIEGEHWHRIDGNTVHYTAAGLRIIRKAFRQ